MPNIPAWSVFDSNFREKYAEETLGIAPGEPDPDWLARDTSLEGLARRAGIDAKGLVNTVERFNRFAREQKDRDFRRGEFQYDWHFVPNVKGNPEPWPHRKAAVFTPCGCIPARWAPREDRPPTSIGGS